MMTADQLIDMLVARLVREHGGSKHHWRRVVGTARLYSRATHPHCNWSVTPTGTVREIAVLETLLDQMRIDHPLLTN